MQKRQTINPVQRIVLISLFIALAVVIRNFSYMVYFGGVAGMRISFAEIFTKLTAIIYGPFYGGIAAGIVDVLGYLVQPIPPFIPYMTVVAICGGFITGYLWYLFKRLDLKMLYWSIFGLLIIIGVFGIVNHTVLMMAPGTSWGKILDSLGNNKHFLTYGLEAICIVGLVFYGFHYLTRKRRRIQRKESGQFIYILIATGLGGLVVSILNTFLIIQYFGLPPQMTLWIFLITRVIKEVLMTIIQTYVITLLLAIYQRNRQSSLF